jgi:D-amino-acid oxidase
MKPRVAIIGAGVSGLTCGVVFAERGYDTAIFAEESGQQTTSAVAAAIWYPYDAEPAHKVIAWSMQSYETFRKLTNDSNSGVSMIELRNYSRTDAIEIPAWAHSLGARALPTSSPTPFASGFTINVPLIDTTIYLDYLANRFAGSGGDIHSTVRFNNLEDVSPEFDLVINCAGIGAKSLVDDRDLESHRGQVVIVPKLDLPHAVVCDDAPLTYAIPRANDCVFGGTNDVSDDQTIDSATTARIVAECSRALGISPPKPLTARVGLRPFRKTGVRVEREALQDKRAVIHNYGHGGSGVTLSWGCANAVSRLCES